MKNKYIDIIEMAMTLIAIITGFMLHSDVHHKFVYDNDVLWGCHETAGIILAATIVCHCVQHSFWFKNYSKIPHQRKNVTTIFLVTSVFVVCSGVLLMCGSHSKFVSIFHYVTAIIFTVLAIGHSAKRWKIFRNLL